MLKDISIAEAQNIEFDLFLKFKAFCEEHNLQYYLCAGTLLGAVRHTGFIPWDDDMDVMMPRPDYDRLIELAPQFPEGIEFFSCETDPEYNYPFAKLCDMRYKLTFAHHKQERSIGMYIDIFPIEGLPGSALGMKVYYRRMKLLDIFRNAALRGEYLPGEKFVLIKKLITPFICRRTSNAYARKMNDLARKIPFGTTTHSGLAMPTHYGAREGMRAEIFQPGQTVTFRSETCPAPIGWDAYLRNLYGDYMQLPPESQRVTDHSHFTIEVRD